jgi:hypothetical protein
VSSILEGADRRFATAGTLVPDSEGIAAMAFDIGFDSSLHNPIGWSPMVPDGFEDDDGLRVWSALGQTVAAATTSGPVSRRRIIEMRASGVPVFSGTASVAEAEAAMQDVEFLWRNSVAGRRRSYRRSSSRVRERSFVDAMGIDVPETRRDVGALLLTNKPEFVLGAVNAVVSQSYAPVQLVLGLHGEPRGFDPMGGDLDERD